MSTFSFRSLSETDYHNQCFDVIQQVEGVELLPYADSRGIVTIGSGFNLAVQSVFDATVNALTLTLTLAQKQALFAVVQKKYTPNDNAAVRNAINEKMAEFHKQNANIPSTLAFTSEAQLSRVFLVIAPTYEAAINQWLTGIPYSIERVMLFSFAYNSPKLLGNGLRNAINNNNRALCWYEIRYNSNGGKNQHDAGGIAKRRYYEASLFSLYYDTTKATFLEATQVGQMYAQYQEKIEQYEKKHSQRVTAANTNYDVSLIQSLGKVQTLTESLQLAIQRYAELYQITNGADIERLLVDYIPKDSSEELNELSGGDFNDLIIGGNGNNILKGGKGTNILIGGIDQSMFYCDNDAQNIIIDFAETSQLFLSNQRIFGQATPLTEPKGTHEYFLTVTDGSFDNSYIIKQMVICSILSADYSCLDIRRPGDKNNFLSIANYYEGKMGLFLMPNNRAFSVSYDCSSASQEGSTTRDLIITSERGNIFLVCNYIYGEKGSALLDLNHHLINSQLIKHAAGAFLAALPNNNILMMSSDELSTLIIVWPDGNTTKQQVGRLERCYYDVIQTLVNGNIIGCCWWECDLLDSSGNLLSAKFFNSHGESQENGEYLRGLALINDPLGDGMFIDAIATFQNNDMMMIGSDVTFSDEHSHYFMSRKRVLMPVNAAGLPLLQYLRPFGEIEDRIAKVITLSSNNKVAVLCYKGSVYENIKTNLFSLKVFDAMANSLGLYYFQKNTYRYRIAPLSDDRLFIAFVVDGSIYGKIFSYQCAPLIDSFYIVESDWLQEVTAFNNEVTVFWRDHYSTLSGLTLSITQILANQPSPFLLANRDMRVLTAPKITATLIADPTEETTFKMTQAKGVVTKIYNMKDIDLIEFSFSDQISSATIVMTPVEKQRKLTVKSTAQQELNITHTLGHQTVILYDSAPLSQYMVCCNLTIQGLATREPSSLPSIFSPSITGFPTSYPTGVPSWFQPFDSEVPTIIAENIKPTFLPTSNSENSGHDKNVFYIVLNFSRNNPLIVGSGGAAFLFLILLYFYYKTLKKCCGFTSVATPENAKNAEQILEKDLELEANTAAGASATLSLENNTQALYRRVRPQAIVEYPEENALAL